MSVEVGLYLNTSEPNRVHKSIALQAAVSGEPRGEISVLNPTFVINVPFDISSCNYMSAFGRYYFITEITCIREDIWAVSGHVDPLYTYREQIGACQCIFSRAENKALYNLYLPDDRLNITTKRVVYQSFIGSPMNTSEPSMILTVAG